MRFDPAQARLLLAQPLLDLGAADPQHSSELIERRLVVEELADLVEAEAEIAQRQQPVQTRELRHRVRAVPVVGVDALGTQQADLVVVPQHPRRDLAEAGKVSDAQHDNTSEHPHTV